MSLFATKPMDVLVKEAQEGGEHSLRRTLGAFQLTALGVVVTILGVAVVSTVRRRSSPRPPGSST